MKSWKKKKCFLVLYEDFKREKGKEEKRKGSIKKKKIQ